MNGNNTRRIKVEAGGTGVVAHVGLHALGAFADRIGLGTALSGAVTYRGRVTPVHDRGKVLVQTALTLAGGGETCCDVEHLGVSPALFGDVPSDTTVTRTLAGITSKDRDEIAAALAAESGKGCETVLGQSFCMSASREGSLTHATVGSLVVWVCGRGTGRGSRCRRRRGFGLGRLGSRSRCRSERRLGCADRCRSGGVRGCSRRRTARRTSGRPGSTRSFQGTPGST